MRYDIFFNWRMHTKGLNPRSQILTGRLIKGQTYYRYIGPSGGWETYKYIGTDPPGGKTGNTYFRFFLHHSGYQGWTGWHKDNVPTLYLEPDHIYHNNVLETIFAMDQQYKTFIQTIDNETKNIILDMQAERSKCSAKSQKSKKLRKRYNDLMSEHLSLGYWPPLKEVSF